MLISAVLTQAHLLLIYPGKLYEMRIFCMSYMYAGGCKSL